MSNSIIEEKNILLSSSGPGPVQVQSQSNLKESLRMTKTWTRSRGYNHCATHPPTTQTTFLFAPSDFKPSLVTQDDSRMTQDDPRMTQDDPRMTPG